MIHSLCVPVGGATLQLLVRYADTPEEKRAKRANTTATSAFGAPPRAEGVNTQGGRSDTPLPAGFTAFSTPGDPSGMHGSMFGAAHTGEQQELQPAATAACTAPVCCHPATSCAQLICS